MSTKGSYITQMGQWFNLRAREIADGLTIPQHQRIASNGREMAVAFPSFVQRFAGEMYQAEQFEPTGCYPQGYKPQPLKEQFRVLRDCFPQLRSYDRAVEERDLLEGAEGRYLIPLQRVIADGYLSATARALYVLAEVQGPVMLASSMPFWPSPRKRRFLRELEAQQPGHDVLVVDAQFGQHHACHSPRRAMAMIGADLHPSVMESPLGLYESVMMAIGSRGRFTNMCDLLAVCAGDFLDDHRRATHRPILGYTMKGMYVSADMVHHHPYPGGVVSAFLRRTSVAEDFG